MVGHTKVNEYYVLKGTFGNKASVETRLPNTPSFSKIKDARLFYLRNKQNGESLKWENFKNVKICKIKYHEEICEYF